MAADLSNAFLILLIGMVTVFTILALVTWSGKGLIILVNSLYDRQQIKNEKTQVPKKIIAIAAAVVNEITEGNGEVGMIKRK